MKKILLTLGTVAVVVAPVTSIVACGASKNRETVEIQDRLGNDQVPKDLTGYVIPSSVTTIGMGAFDGKKIPSGFIVPNGVTSIEDYAFEDATLPDGFKLPSSITNLGDGVFKNVKLPEGFTIPSSVKYIGSGAFQGDNTLPKGFNIPSSVKDIGSGAFQGDTLPEGFTIPSSYRHNLDATFKGVKIPKGMVWIDKDGKKNRFSIEGTVGNIRWLSSEDVPKDLTGYAIPSSVTTIGDSAFKDATLPAGFTIPSSVTTIGASAFNDDTLPHGMFWLDKNDAKIADQDKPSAGDHVGKP